MLKHLTVPRMAFDGENLLSQVFRNYDSQGGMAETAAEAVARPHLHGLCYESLG